MIAGAPTIDDDGCVVSRRARFPGIARSDWARFDAPSGTQMVDAAIEAMTTWMASGSTAAAGGPFAAADECAALVDRARRIVGTLFTAEPEGVVFGANMTTLTFAFSRAVGATLRPGDRVVGTRLDHDANVTPWSRAAEDAGAQQVLAPFDPHSGTLDPAAVIELIDGRTRWVTLPAASNLLGTVPNLAPIVAAAHDAGAKVFVDAVAYAPHHRLDIEALGADAVVTSVYKWYGPHAGMLWARPALLDSLPVYKLRPAPITGPGRFETGMPNFAGLAGIVAAANFLLREGLPSVTAYEAEVFRPLLEGLQAIPGVTLHGPATMTGRIPTAAFTVRGRSPSDVARALAGERIAVWDGHNYAVEVVGQLGLAQTGGVVRAGLARYVEPSDVQRLLTAVERVAPRPASSSGGVPAQVSAPPIAAAPR
jgi:cysteine desulfurase family protein (TIGR01976 family)